jgi:ferredoxin
MFRFYRWDQELASMAITHVRFDSGCIRCSACAYSAPEIFELPAGGDATIRGCARASGCASDANEEHGFALIGVDEDQEMRIREAVEGCPVSIIHARDDGA